eukprot:1475843-Amphidinium_carterae.1
MEAAIEHLLRLLYPKFAHYTFTIAALRILKVRIGGNGMSLRSSFVLLKFSWLMVTLFGPCLPILNALIALLAKNYSILLFGCSPQILDMKETIEYSSFPGIGFRTVALVAFVLHVSNLL